MASDKKTPLTDQSWKDIFWTGKERFETWSELGQVLDSSGQEYQESVSP